MKHPERWRDSPNPFDLPLKEFKIESILGYPHAGNDVYHVIGQYKGQETEAYIKIARQKGADIKNEIETIQKLRCSIAPPILEYDEIHFRYIVTAAMKGDRLSVIIGENKNLQSISYLYEYGQNLALLHGKEGDFQVVKDRRFFHIPSKEELTKSGISEAYTYLTDRKPIKVNKCFCHGDFHYANILWENHRITAILDFELSGIGIREFDIAWALILRPGQKFLSTAIELERFKEGYCSLGEADWEIVTYYMVQIYCYFITFEESGSDYYKYVSNFIKRQIN